MVLAAEMTGPARVDSVQLLCARSTYNHGIFYNVRIFICPTPLSQLTTNYNDNYGTNTPQLVMSCDTLPLRWRENEWQSLVFDSAFIHDGTNNFIIEFRWQGDNDSAVYARAWYPPGGARVLDGYSLTNPTGTLRDYMNCLRIYYESVGIDEMKESSSSTNIKIFPNPFNSSVTIQFALTQSQDMKFYIYDPIGRLMRVLRLKPEKPGFHNIVWDGKDERGKAVKPGIYFLRIDNTNHHTITKLILTR